MDSNLNLSLNLNMAHLEHTFCRTFLRGKRY